MQSLQNVLWHGLGKVGQDPQVAGCLADEKMRNENGFRPIVLHWPSKISEILLDNLLVGLNGLMKEFVICFCKDRG